MSAKSKAWSIKDIPDLSSKLAVVTGGTGGIGYETSLALAGAGACVILAGRSDSKGNAALDKIKAIHPNCNISFGKLDLCSLASISEFSSSINDSGKALDILINNAGVMAPPKRLTTTDGFELQLGTNHLAHFALTAQLLPSLRKSSSPRVINVSSWVARMAKMNFDDLQYEKSYSPIPSYGQTKLANLLFTFELQRRSEEGGWGLQAIASHPGWSRTDLVANGMGESSILGRLGNLTKPIFSQSAADGALSTLFAATSPDAKPSGFYGPSGFMELKGHVCDSAVSSAAKDQESAKKLWDISVELCGVTWPSNTT